MEICIVPVSYFKNKWNVYHGTKENLMKQFIIYLLSCDNYK